MQKSAARVGQRVELSPHLDLWVRGARYGHISGFDRGLALVRMDHRSVRKLQRVPLDGLRSEAHGAEYGALARRLAQATRRGR